MKKLTLIIIILFFAQLFCVFADEHADEHKDDSHSEETVKQKEPFGIKDRSFEIGIANLHVYFANNFLSASDIFQDLIVIDLDKLADGFNFNFGAHITPYYFKYDSKAGWGFGLSTDVDVIGVLNLSGNMLSLSEALKDDSDIGGAVFSSITITSFFKVQNFKIKVNPSFFAALAYLTPPENKTSSLIYTLDYSDGTVAYVDYDMRLYTGYTMDDNGDIRLTSKPGLDFSIGLEYPLAKEIGLSKVLPFLDFDIGLDFINIPFIPYTMEDYKQYKGRVGKDQPIKLINRDDDSDDDGFFSIDDVVEGKEEIKVYRPFKALARADWRPLLGSRLLTITPVIGFCHNDLYYKPYSLEAGLNACVNLANFFLVRAGFNYTDRMYVSSVGFALNLRAFEIDLGADIRSQEFAQAWKGSGLGVSLGFKFGW